MTRAQRRYILAETVISIAINTAISIGFAWLMFGGARSIAIHAIILDSIPQSFMITLMSVLVPGVLTARRIGQRALAPLSGPAPRWPLPARAVCAALVAVAAGLAAHAGLASLAAPPAAGIGFPALLAIKIAYGATLAAIVTPIMLRYAMRSPAHGAHPDTR